MRLILALAALLTSHYVCCEEKSWNWEGNKPEQASLEAQQNPEYLEDFQASPSEFIESSLQLNDTTAEQVIDEILSSTRQGKALNGFDELYADPNIQDILQKGDETQARNLIKDRLCYLGLMKCEDNIEGKRPYIAPEELVYAQPVAINPVGKPIPTIPLKGVRGGGYGPPKPVPYPPSHSSGPPGKFGPPPSNKFGPPNNYGSYNSGFSQSKPPRRHYGPVSSKPGFGKPPLSGEYYEGPEFLAKPPFLHGGDYIESVPPYKFEQGSHQSGFHKDKRVEIAVNAQGGAFAANGGSSAPSVEHVHHHYHHNLEGANKPTVVVNPIPIAAAAVSTDLSSSSNSFTSSNLFGSSGSLGTGFNPSSGLGGFSSSSGVLGSSIGGSSLNSGFYGGKPTVNYGSGPFDTIKPVSENYGAQSFDSFGTSVGSFGSSSLYKKELNINPINNNFIQSNYAEKYQGLESARAENYDCICVPYDQCPSHDVIGRKDDLYLALDPRSLKSDIEALPALSEEERVITDGNGTMTVVTVVKSEGLNGTTVNEQQKSEKKVSKREAPDQKAASTENTEGRQFYGGRPQTCGPRHVCCKRPHRPHVPVSQVNRQCGTRHSQGINGRIKNPVYVDGDSEFGEYPWQVAILKKDPKESVYVCGGTLIDPLHIITAAHCVKTYTGFDLRVRLGEWDVNHDVEFFPYIERDIVSVHVHPEFYAGTLYNDLAILRMEKPVDFAKYPHISPACLPHPQDDYTGTRCWTTGWGKDAFGDFGKYQNILKEVDVPIINNGVCQRQLQNTRLGYDFKLHPGFICAGGEEGKDACKGDGGGPMVCERGGTWQVVGIVSWGIGCGQVGVPGVYVKVAHYLDWIRQITQRY